MKIEKISINTNTRKLSANYTFEVSQDLEHAFGDELQRVIDNEVMHEIFKASEKFEDWHTVTVDHWDNISNDWIKENIKKEYHCFGHYWYFKEKSDAVMFSLTWK